jgi:hypothetical protein
MPDGDPWSFLLATAFFFLSVSGNRVRKGCWQR